MISTPDVYIGWLEPTRGSVCTVMSYGKNALDVAASLARMGADTVVITVYVALGAPPCHWTWSRREWET